MPSSADRARELSSTRPAIASLLRFASRPIRLMFSISYNLVRPHPVKPFGDRTPAVPRSGKSMERRFSSVVHLEPEYSAHLRTIPGAVLKLGCADDATEESLAVPNPASPGHFRARHG